MTTAEEVMARLPATLEREWALTVTHLELAQGGMNSVTAAVDAQAGRVYAKWVYREAVPDLVNGVEVALQMGQNGLRSGRPILSASGRLTAPLLDGEFAVLEEVAGSALGRTTDDLRDWGVTLSRVHAFGTWQQSGNFLPWLREVGTNAARERWVRLAVEEVLKEYDNLPPLTWAQIHSDPAPEAFIRDSHGDVGVIDWAGSVPGPVLYDLASAAMYAGNELNASLVVDAYRSTNVVSETEIAAHLPALRRLRAAVQAAYFSKRLAESNLTGISGDAENEEGLADASLLLQAAGIAVRDRE